MRYLSDVNLRAVLIVLIERAGGKLDTTNAQLYDAMLRGEGEPDGFLVEETESGCVFRSRRAPGEPRGLRRRHLRQNWP
ncbi:hypothetical protein [Actinoplanes subtropicus]|uniref:hypothetical protein n=1 Tax=Actinoplanes subtropicus TaxID=543632 RepID=UPI0012F8927C|nr:hypothetical protein [Actinoplanes subtropicus]